MDDVDSKRADNLLNLREIKSKWESLDNPLAPLTNEQRDIIRELEYLDSTLYDFNDGDSANTPKDEGIQSDNAPKDIPTIDNTMKFFEWYEALNHSILKTDDLPYENYYKQLEERRNECTMLLDQVKASLDDLTKLSEEYNLVSTKTNTLHTMSEHLLAEQTKLNAIGEDIKQRLHYFTQVEHISQRLSSLTMSINSEAFFNVLTKIDDCMKYMKAHNNYKESHTYLVKYRHCLNRAISLIRSYVNQVLNHATEHVLAPREDGEVTDIDTTMDTAFAVYFGKFQAAVPKLRTIIEEIEKRVDICEEYAHLLGDIQREYASRRQQVAGVPMAAALAVAAKSNKGDHCSLLRSTCSLLAHAARDECALYDLFFNKPSPALDEYLLTLCNGLYETLRPYIIHVNHLETLAEICAILRVEVLEEQVQNDPVSLAALGQAASSLLQDAQERLVFRAHVHLRADVLNYKPAPGDLAYPEKLEMMEQIALSLQEPNLRRSDSRNSIVSDVSATSQEVANINVEAHRRPVASPADLHGMWYPGVRRTLAALSRLYRCLERRVFQGLAQEAISLCVTSVDSAAKQISANKTNIDGELFQIKHLLIVREQIAPFQVDFIIKETSLDFSNVKNAAYGLLQKRRHIFALNSNNALLEFLLEGTPMVKEQLLDSRKEVDRQLKSCCEMFIKHATEILSSPLIAFVEKAQAIPAEQLRSQHWATPEQIGGVIKDCQRRIKSQLAPVQRSMQLYLANKETEFILFRPIRNNVVGYFVQVDQLLTNAGYSSDDMIIVSCPTPEQVSVLISSASLLAGNDQAMPYGKIKKKVSTTIRPSLSNITEKKEESKAATNVEVTSEKEKTFVV